MTEFEIGNRIVQLRKEKGVTQMQLAEAIGVSDKAVSKWETGGSYPDITLIPAIADYFHVSNDYILCGNPRKQTKLFCIPAMGMMNGISVKTINEEYLDKGWELVDWKMSSEKDATMLLVVLQKEIAE